MQSALQLAVLGKPQLTYNAQPLTADLISAKGQALLIYLAVSGRPYSRTALAGLLWGDMPEETARANLRLTLSKLRKFLPETVLFASRLEIGLVDFWLDANEFEKRLEIRDWRLNKQSDLISLQSLLAFYRGDFLDDFHVPNAPDFEEWVVYQREAWRQTAVTKLNQCVETAVQANDHANGIPLARKLLTIEPWHEESHRHLMHLLAISGQRSAALAQYESCRRLLDEELGIEPTAETIALYESIKAGEQGRFPPSPPPPSHNLPTQLTLFIGREAERSYLAERLQHSEYRLITLLGEGGVGKTRLALAVVAQAKEQFADGVWFVSLAGLETADPPFLENNIATTIAATIGLIFAAAEPPKTQLINYLRHKQCLLLLDNFEPLLTAAGFVMELLTAVPQLTILTTSREPLHLQAELIVRVVGLTLPETADSPNALQTDGIRFFAERAQRTAGKPVVTADTLPDVLQLCRYVNGSPLGIELIASWTRWLSLPAIWRGLQANEVRLETDLPDVAARHRTMQAVFDYSWELLNPEEQSVLAQLAVFRRSFQMEAMQQVVQASPTTLFALVDKSLVQHRDDDRYGLHELLRQYAAARQADLALDQPALHDRHAHTYLHLAGQYEAALVGPQPHRALRRMQADSENLAAAWQWAAERPLPEALNVSASGMGNYWAYAGLNDEGQQALTNATTAVEPLLDLVQPQPDLCRLLARLQAERAGLLFDLTRLDEMETAAKSCLRWAQVVGDDVLMAHGRLRLAQIWWRRGDFEAAGDDLQQAQTLSANHHQPILKATIWRNLAAVSWKLGDQGAAKDACRRSLHLHQQAGDVRGANRANHFLAILAIEAQAYETIPTFLQPVLQSAQATGERRVEMGAYALLGQAAGYLGQFEQALAYLAQEQILAEELNMAWQMGSNASNTGDVRLRLGDFAGAQASYERALTIFRQLQSVGAESNVLAFMGLLACQQGQFDDGLALCATAMQLAQQANARREQAFAHLFGGHNLAGLGRWREARQAYEQAQVAWQTLGAPGRLLEAQAGAVKAAWQLDDMAGAATAVHTILSHLQDHTVTGTDDPLHIYLTCYEVLQQVGDERAQEVLANGRAFLQARANQIHDPALRQGFLENIPTHRTIYQELEIRD